MDFTHFQLAGAVVAAMLVAVTPVLNQSAKLRRLERQVEPNGGSTSTLRELVMHLSESIQHVSNQLHEHDARQRVTAVKLEQIERRLHEHLERDG